MKTQISIMLELQQAMNEKVHPQWRNQGFEWYRAIWIECAELMDHYGWKWWKKQTPDVEQVKLELIDIWHFGLSDLLIKGATVEDVVEQVSKAFNQNYNDHFFYYLEEFTAHTLTTKDFSVEKFVALLSNMQMTLDDLYVGYVGKNVLNFFRQDHGYKDGTYQKVWAGREDNEHLVELAIEQDTSAPDFKDKLYQALSQRYQELCIN